MYQFVDWQENDKNRSNLSQFFSRNSQKLLKAITNQSSWS